MLRLSRTPSPPTWAWVSIFGRIASEPTAVSTLTHPSLSGRQGFDTRDGLTRYLVYYRNTYFLTPSKLFFICDHSGPGADRACPCVPPSPHEPPPHVATTSSRERPGAGCRQTIALANYDEQMFESAAA